MPYDVVIVGMGSAGLVAAEFAATLGLRVAAVERDRVGGDCLWTGCVPSKALLASAKVAHHMRTADRYGLPAVDPAIDTRQVWKRIRAIQEEIAATDDSPARYEALGVEIVHGSGRIAGPRAVEVGGRTLDSRFILLCTGSRPAVPPIDGLEEAGFLTSESVFALETPPQSLVVVGGGPIGVEFAQGMRRLGLHVTLLEEAPRLLLREEPALAEILTRRLREEGVDVHVGVRASRVNVEEGAKVISGTENGTSSRWQGDELLIAVGRRPNLDGLGLDAVGVRVGPKGVEVDGRGRTSVPSIFAAGDVAGRFLFTHSAGHEAALAVRNMFFPGKAKMTDLVPWCTFTDPELAHAGLTAAEADERYGARKVAVHRADLSHSDRARADGAAEGAILLVAARGKLVGAHILAPAAGEMIHEAALAIRDGRSLRHLSSLVHVYPTVSTSVNLLASQAAFERAKSFSWLLRKERRSP